MEKKTILLILRLVLLAALTGITGYIYINKDKDAPQYSTEKGDILRRYMEEGLTIEGPVAYTERITANYYDGSSSVTRNALKAAEVGNGVLAAGVYEMVYDPNLKKKEPEPTPEEKETKDSPLTGTGPAIMCSAALKGDFAVEDGELRIYRLVDDGAELQQMFMRDKNPAWLSEGADSYLIVRLYPEELLVAEAELTEEQPEEPTPTPEPTATPTPTPKPTPRPTPTTAPAQNDERPADQPTPTKKPAEGGEGEEEIQTFWYATAQVNIRKAPSLDAEVIGMAEKGETLYAVLETEDPEWFVLDFHGQTGYISSKFCALK